MHPLSKHILIFSFFIASLWDIRSRTIPDLTHILILAAGVLNLVTGGISIWEAFSSLLIMTGASILLTLTIDSIGGGDLKMISSTAFACGLYSSIQALLLSFLLAGAYILIGKSLKKLKGDDAIPLAPFLSAGYIVALFANI
ncbi:A24 family peptidase (plasmid) [Oscillospiraceae bacterium MB08-C2-2]|nr:A24 family peptidase [Oscillospiraceae bacterium MB08-C2-2]